MANVNGYTFVLKSGEWYIAVPSDTAFGHYVFIRENPITKEKDILDDVGNVIRTDYVLSKMPMNQEAVRFLEVNGERVVEGTTSYIKMPENFLIDSAYQPNIENVKELKAEDWGLTRLLTITTPVGGGETVSRGSVPFIARRGLPFARELTRTGRSVANPVTEADVIENWKTLIASLLVNKPIT